MIPKIIHYCWFGHNPYPAVVKKCLASWKRYCPDYEIRLWNEDNYDVTRNPYCREAYEAKKWAFVSDYARLDIVYRYGGIYLDTDVELIRSPDDLLTESCFFAREEKYIATGLGFGAEAGHPMVEKVLRSYDSLHFLSEGKPVLTTCPKSNTEVFLPLGYNPESPELQRIGGAVILPKAWFDPIDGPSSRLCLTADTHGIHRYQCSWGTPLERCKAFLRLHLGLEFIYRIKKIFRS